MTDNANRQVAPPVNKLHYLLFGVTIWAYTKSERINIYAPDSEENLLIT